MAKIEKKLNYSKSYRLKSKSDFDEFFLASKNIILGTIKLFYRSSENVPRIGISVSSKFFNAVRRNILKRQIRELFRHNKDLFKSMDVVISIRYSMMAKDNWPAYKRRVLQDIKSALTTIKKIVI